MPFVNVVELQVPQVYQEQEETGALESAAPLQEGLGILLEL